MATRRTQPYVWTTWITKLLSGECSCEWATWFKAHYRDFEQASDTFDSVGWQVQHTDLLRRVREQIAAEGRYAITVEGQNLFKLTGSVGTLSGKPDLIAVNGNSGFILDAKTGQPRAADRVQILLYMWAVPRSLPKFKNVTFDGKVCYTNGESIVFAQDLTPSFIQSVREMLWRVCDSTPAFKVPSAGECRYCKITAADCSERVDEAADDCPSAETDEF
jgi:hypothetical protein